MLTAKRGNPMAKLFVPSMGSTIQKADSCGRRLLSSPQKPREASRAESCSRMSVSAATSASVTMSLALDLVRTSCRPCGAHGQNEVRGVQCDVDDGVNRNTVYWNSACFMIEIGVLAGHGFLLWWLTRFGLRVIVMLVWAQQGECTAAPAFRQQFRQ